MLANIIRTILITVLIAGCGKQGAPRSSGENVPEIAASGEVRDGYRYLTPDQSAEPIQWTVYRGDYIKFNIVNTQMTAQQYPLEIPELAIHQVLESNIAEQPYFKMKTVGEYPFSLGTRKGIIRVVELQQSNYRELSPEEAWKLLHNNPPFLLDVRTANEFRTGYIKGAHLIPLQELQQRLAELDQYRNQPILIYCATGNRSTTASKILLDEGFKNVMNLGMGIVGWGSKGYMVQF